MTPPFLHRLFEVVGIEIEYMIVDRATLDVRPIADELIRAQCGAYESEVELGAVAWSNELVLHLIEMKTNGPVKDLRGLAREFQASVVRANRLLEPFGAVLLPSGMHPWMDPSRELRLWPHEYAAVYQRFDGIFGCAEHGWANVQSTHVNLPFGDDEEFGRLHAALRLLLPILPALAASSPVVEGQLAEVLDARLEAYRAHAREVPAVVGAVIPEPLFTRAEYEDGVLRRIYDELASRDPEGLLHHEWVNARGAIARFDRGAIEVRLLDVQECPVADLAVAAAVTAATRALVEERFAPRAEQRAWGVERLAAILHGTVREAEQARIEDAAYLRALGFRGPAPARAGEVWRHLVEETLAREPGFAEWEPALTTILEEGCLARRLRKRLGPAPGRPRLAETWDELRRCLAEGRLFRAGL